MREGFTLFYVYLPCINNEIMTEKRDSRYSYFSERKRLVEASRSLNAEPALESRMKIRRISGVSGRRESCLHGIFSFIALGKQAANLGGNAERFGPLYGMTALFYLIGKILSR